jgi:hypothetical protein
MAGKIITEGKTDVLTWYLKNDQSSRGADELFLGLYLDTTEPLINATLATITELALAGYARIQLIDSAWVVASDEGINVLKTFTAAIDWSNVYGWFVCNIAAGTAGELLFVKHFTNGPFNVLDTKTIDITPKIQIP